MVDEDLLHERQAEPGPALFRRKERVEDLADVRRADPGPRIVNGDRDASRGLPHRDLEPARRRARHRLTRVAYQVDHRLPELRLVGRNVGQPRSDVDRHLDAGLRQLAARHIHDRRHDRADVLALQLRTRQPGEAQVGLGDLGQPIDLADDRRHQPLRLIASFGDLIPQQLGVEADRGQRVADLVGDVRGHPPDGGQLLRSDQAPLALLDRLGHRVELAREIADLVVRGDARALGIVSAAELPRVGTQHRQRPQGAQREQESRAGDREPGRSQPQRNRQRRLTVIGQALRDLPALAPQRAPHPIQIVRQRREVALELGARLRIDRGGRGPELAGDRVELAAQRRDLAASVLEVRPTRRLGLLLEVAVDDTERVVQVLAPHAQGQRQVGIQPRRVSAAQRRHEVVERLPGGVHRALQFQISLVRDDTLAGALDGKQRERRIARERQQQHAQREQNLEAHEPTLARPVPFHIFEQF